MKFSLTWTGLPRFIESTILQLDRSAFNSARIETELASLWDFKQDKPISTFQGPVKIASTELDWAELSRAQKLNVHRMQPLEKTTPAWDHNQHPSVGSLGLAPLPEAMLSWMTAISRAAQQLTKHARFDDDLWVITRADMRIISSSLEKALILIGGEIRDGQIYLTGRPKPHNVLRLGSSEVNLPIDHLIIGKPMDIAKLAHLETYANKAISGHDLRQPLVSEFILGQFLSDQGLAPNSVFFGCVVWRGTWWRSFTPIGNPSLRAILGNMIDFFWLSLRPKLRQDSRGN